MSHVADTSNPTPDKETLSSTSRSRVASDCSVVGKSAKKLKYNEHGMPIGWKAKQATRIGDLARTFIPVSYGDWPSVDIRYKDQVWDTLKDDYPELKTSQRHIFMAKTCNAWKKLKGKLRLTLVGDDVEQWKKKVPEKIRSEDWEKFCIYEAREAQKLLRVRNANIKKNSEQRSTHNTGRDGYAVAAEKYEEENGHPPSRAELWLYTHMRKDNTYAPHDQEFADNIKKLLEVFKERGEEEAIDSGPLYEVFGKETRGRVRCVGPAISRKAMLASAFARDMLKEVNTNGDDMKVKVDAIQEEIGGLKSMFYDFVNDLKEGKFSINHGNIPPNSVPVAIPTSFPATSPASFPTPAPTHVTNASSASKFTSLGDLTECKILSFTKELLGLGRKGKLGATTVVHGHTLGPREVRVILDIIKKPDYPIWDGKQNNCTNLADVGTGGFMYWHDDLCPPDC